MSPVFVVLFRNPWLHHNAPPPPPSTLLLSDKRFFGSIGQGVGAGSAHVFGQAIGDPDEVGCGGRQWYTQETQRNDP